MKVGTFAVVAVVYILIIIASTRIAANDRDESTDVAIAHANQSPSAPAHTVRQDGLEIKKLSHPVSLAYSEPLLLLILGSTLLVLASAINLLLTKKTHTGSIRVATNGK